MIILGIDPGLTRCGVGVVEASSSRQVKYIDSFLFQSEPQATLDQRLKSIGQNIKNVITKYKPDVVVCEKVFAQENRASVIGTAQVSGMAIYLAASNNIKVGVHTPTEIKAAVTGSGKAAKGQVQYMVQKVLKLNKLPTPPDLADALAVAICHAWNPTSVSVDDTASKTPAQQAWIEAIKKTRKSGYFNR